MEKIQEVQLINVREAMKILSLSRSKIYEMIKSQQIPYVRFDRHIKFSIGDLKNFIESKKQERFVSDFNVGNLKKGSKYNKKR
jgi:excisionase family DNA binding protein